MHTFYIYYIYNLLNLYCAIYIRIMEEIQCASNLTFFFSLDSFFFSIYFQKSKTWRCIGESFFLLYILLFFFLNWILLSFVFWQTKVSIFYFFRLFYHLYIVTKSEYIYFHGKLFFLLFVFWSHNWAYFFPF